MTGPCDYDSSKTEVKQLAASCSLNQIPLLVDIPSFPLSRGPKSANAAIDTPGSWCEYLPQYTSSRAPENTQLAASKSNNKGKGVQRGLDWHTAAHDASESEREELVYHLLASLSRSRLASVQRRIVPLLQFDLVGSLPPELSLQIFTLLSATTLLNCTLVCRRWNLLVNDQTLWRNLCHARGWEWRPRFISPSHRQNDSIINPSASGATREDRDEDEGMGDEEEGEDEGSVVDAEQAIHVPNGGIGLDNESISTSLSLQDHDFQDLNGQFISILSPTALMPISRNNSTSTTMTRSLSQRHASPSCSRASVALAVDYKLLHQTHTLLRNRVRHGAYHLRALPGAEGGGHTAAVYCLALWSYNSTYGPLQVLFTGSKDRTIREWDLNTSKMRRKVVGMHTSSVLSLCVTATAVRIPEDGVSGSADHGREGCKDSEAGVLVSGGSDCHVVVWDLSKFRSIKVLKDHQDSVLCVRTDGRRLVSCSKDRTIRTYAFPWLKLDLVLRGHRAAVNAVSIAGDVVVSGSGDRSVRVWDARTGALISNFEDHHARAISSVELSPPFILSGSSDRHVRMFDMRTKRGWSTCPEFDISCATQALDPSVIAQQSLDGGVPESGNPFFLHSSLSQSFHCTRQDSRTSESEAKVCSTCGTRIASTGGPTRGPERHSHPVRSVAVGDEFVVSGSYDCTVKVWNKTTGALVSDLTSGHTGRIFCVAQDSTKIVSCGEDQRICIWDFSHGIDTTFIKL